MIGAFFKLIRPWNVLLTMLAVYVGGIIACSKIYVLDLLSASLSAGLIAAFGNVINDLFDIEIDRHAKPFRPLAAGQISPSAAAVAATSFAAIGVALAAVVEISCLVIALLVVAGLLFYTPFLKGRGYTGNIVIAAIAALSFLYGAASVGNGTGGIVATLFAFLFHFVREIIKDMEDREGDARFGIKTGAVVYGIRVSRLVASIAGLLLIIGTLLPFAFGLYGIIYLIFVIVGTDIIIIFVIVKLWRSTKPRQFGLLARTMKVIMPLGIFAILLGSRGY